METRCPEQVVEALDHDIGTVFCQRPDHAREGGKGMGTPVVFRAVRDLAGHDGRAQRPLRAIGGRLKLRVLPINRRPRITLKPMNPDFRPIEITGAEDGELQVVAELVEVLEGAS